MAAFLCDFPSASTSFNLSLTATAHGSAGSAGPQQTVSATNCRPGLWRVVYTNGYPAGGPNAGNSDGVLNVKGDQYALNPGTGSVGWHSRNQDFAVFLDDGTMTSIGAPATVIGTLEWESFYCAGTGLTFKLTLPYTTYYNGVTISAVGTWQQACSSSHSPALVSD